MQMRIACVLLLLSTLLWPGAAQSQSTATGAQAAPESRAQQAPTQTADPLAQMRDDLNKLESLNLNMSSEIEFLRDQNLQILLRTNSQMWTLLIRDLRREVEQEEQRRAMPRPADHGSTAKPDR
jgi:hypothetical protein